MVPAHAHAEIPESVVQENVRLEGRVRRLGRQDVPVIEAVGGS